MLSFSFKLKSDRDLAKNKTAEIETNRRCHVIGWDKKRGPEDATLDELPQARGKKQPQAGFGSTGEIACVSWHREKGGQIIYRLTWPINLASARVSGRTVTIGGKIY